jgi:hypothetical protein
MGLRENNAYQRLRDRVTNGRDRFQRVENGIGAGMPDVNYCLLGGFEGWIEIKAPHIPARRTTALFSGDHKLMQEQANFFLSQRNAGGLAFLFIATEERLLLLGSEVAQDMRFVNTSTLDELTMVARWRVDLPHFGVETWVHLRSVLCGKSFGREKEDGSKEKAS